MIYEIELGKLQDARSRLSAAYESVASAARYTNDTELRIGLRKDAAEVARAVDAVELRIEMLRSLRQTVRQDTDTIGRGKG